MSHFYITTPIYYVNDKPHIGHAYTTLVADVLARFNRLMDVPTFFLTGTDEHGQKVYEAATAAGISPQRHADDTHVRFRDLWRRLEISNDDFIRTTEQRHRTVVRQILTDLWDKGEIYKGEYAGWYAVREERFYTEKDLVEGLSPEGNPVEKVVEENYFFRMSNYQEWLIDYIHDHPRFIQPAFRRNETLGALKKPLRDLCISRPKSRLPWGIELPFDENYVCYVWFDALVNYISAIGYGSDPQAFERHWPASFHLIGKDILTTHSIYWPTMLAAIGLPQPDTIFAHGWWLMDEAKMSKSVGNVVDPMEMVDRYGVDALRYHVLADMSLGNDASFTEAKFVQRYNADLANDLGNLVSRVVKMVERSFASRLPSPGTAGAAEEALRDHALAAVREMLDQVRAMALDRGIARVLETVRETNRYFDRAAPWSLAKKGELEALGRVLYTAAECLRIISGLLYPVIPERMAALRGALGLAEARIEPHRDDLARWGVLVPGTPIGPLPALFPRIKKAPAVKEKRDDPAPAPEVALCAFEEVGKLGLTTAEVLAASRVAGADRLLRLEIDLGSERREIVAGIAEHYAPEDLVGRMIVVVANLEPATIRGVRSQGMLLAAKKGKRLTLVAVDGSVGPGWSVG